MSACCPPGVAANSSSITVNGSRASAAEIVSGLGCGASGPRIISAAPRDVSARGRAPATVQG
eukprot:CAMPEP_0182899082 /NCGR_PEP_ID=MMETSP0034_2-20130328/27867_1 /TAXON_ID=156128 /ORGANISM="Nephroselmis pyriformis, Strain CCMP717" /LENGTH=61 /DNA_ID=CAMNT_0025033079 /DNA_START=49 /DNA_END=230 /DNA_ORIENTATION=-